MFGLHLFTLAEQFIPLYVATMAVSFSGDLIITG